MYDVTNFIIGSSFFVIKTRSKVCENYAQMGTLRSGREIMKVYSLLEFFKDTAGFLGSSLFR